MLRKEMNRSLSKDMWMFLMGALKCNYINKQVNKRNKQAIK